ncbi:hypothetical protein [Vulcanisaeta moutnovskia]|nr:hypothetical protein [Vulcanisaeta moutnovskia]
MTMYTTLRRLLIIAILIMAITAIITLAASSASQFTTQLRPFKVIKTPYSIIEYFNYSSVSEPQLIIRAYFQNKPINITVSLFAITQRYIIPIGYYRGFGLVSIALDNSSVINASEAWFSHYGDAVWPSLLAIVTYINNDEVYNAFIAIPYPPSYITWNKPLTIVSIVNMSSIKPIVIRGKGSMPSSALYNSIKDPVNTPQVNTSPGSGGGNYGYTYVGSCEISDTYAPEPGSGWVLEDCQEYQGPLVQFFIGWSENALSNSGIELFSFWDVYGGVPSGNGFYGTVNETNPSTGYSFINLVGPLITFNQNMNIELANGWSFVEVQPDLSLSEGTYQESTQNGGLIYQVNGPGFVYLYFDSYVAFVSWYQPSTGIWANGTYVLGLASDSYPGSGNTLYLLPGIDMGNGPVSGMFNGYFSTGYSISQLITDGSWFSSSNGVSTQCNIEYSGVTSNEIAYFFDNVISSYGPTPAGIAYAVGSVLASIFISFISPPAGVALSTVFSIVDTAVGFMIPTTAQQVQFYENANVAIEFNPNNYNFYTTFLGVEAYNPSTGNTYYWPMGMIINYTSYYLQPEYGYQCNS